MKFQFTYTQDSEKALTWDTAYGYSHDKVENHKSTAHAASPYLTREFGFSLELVLERFEAESKGIDARIREAVMTKIRGMPLLQSRQKIQTNSSEESTFEKFIPLFHILGVFIVLLAVLVFIARNGT